MKPIDIIRLVTLSAIWGSSFLFMRIIAPVLGPLPTAFFRVLLGAIGLAIILAGMRITWNFNNKLRAVMVLGAINSAIPFVLFSVAATILPAGYSAIFYATTPLMGVVIGAAFFADKLTSAKVIGVLFGLSGVAVLSRTGPVEFNTNVFLGACACLVATACYGLAGFLTKRWITDNGGLDSKLVALGSQFGATALLLPFFAFTASTYPPVSWGGIEVWLAMAGLGLVCTAFAYILYFRLIADIGPVKSLTVTFLTSPFGALWGAVFLGEQLSWAHAVGVVLIWLAVWMVLKPAKPRELARLCLGLFR